MQLHSCVRSRSPVARADSSAGAAFPASEWRSPVEPLDKLTIDTPEQTALEFPLAGIGSRFLAMTIDTAIQMAVGFVLLVALALAIPAMRYFGSVAPQWVVAIAIVTVFVVYYGYFAFFEAA